MDSFLSFWVIFCSLTLLTTRKIKILKKVKKNFWRYYHFTHALLHGSNTFPVFSLSSIQNINQRLHFFIPLKISKNILKKKLFLLVQNINKHLYFWYFELKKKTKQNSYLKFKLKIFLILLQWSNGLRVKALDSQSKGPMFKTTRWLQGRLSLSSFWGW